ncbi:MAG: glycosyltransferase family 39 protein [Caldilineaceae bacterium]|nr:glycosyltransferase family 39 protein [Caldilineaceae bacterium]
MPCRCPEHLDGRWSSFPPIARKYDSHEIVHFTLHSAAAERPAAVQTHSRASLTGILSARAGYQRYLCVLMLLGIGLRLVMLDRFRFHQDEALYSYWALRFLHDDPQFLEQWIDKPPLFIWLLAYWFQVFGASEASARLLNIGISILTIPIVATIAKRAWSPAAGLVAATVFALNPFAISYSPTAFTDPLLVLAGVCSLFAAQSSRPFLAGLCLGAAVMTKQQGIFFVPLTLAVLIAGNPRAKAMAAAGLRLAGGVALAVLPILYWDSLRWAVAPSPWDLGVRNYSAIELLPVEEWTGRIVRIADLLWYLTASNIVWIVLAATTVLAAAYVPQTELALSKRNSAFVVLLGGWTGMYLGIHAIFSLPVWDRYFLPLAPVFAILCGWLGARILTSDSSLWRQSFVGLWLVLLLPGGVQAARGEFPIGGDHGAYDGLREASTWLDNNSPPGAVLYHQGLSWHFQFYSFESPRDYTVRWVASPVALADDAAKRPRSARFVIAPAWQPLRNFHPQLAARELELVQRAKEGNFTIYELMPRRR